MISIEEERQITAELSEWLAERGWRFITSTEKVNRLEIWIKKAESPPPLKVHIHDGVGTEDKVGG
jgi:hypothetical protein